MENTKHTKDIDLGLIKILCLSNIINRKTELCCFVEDTAHCRYIEIRFYKDVKSYTDVPIKFKIKYDREDSEYCLNEINRCVEFLETTLKDKKIDYSVLHEVKEYVTTSFEI